MEKTLTERAPAKINLYLHLIGKRSDGYHELDSLIIFTQLGDKVFVEPHNKIFLSSYGRFSSSLPQVSQNIILKAAELLQKNTGIRHGAKITLEKNLPVASGLGGGSSDAAAVIKALTRFWDISIADHELKSLALSLGADVPVCLVGKTSYVSGIGEVLEPPPKIPSFWLVLVNPGIEVSTAKIFELHGESAESAERFLQPPPNIEFLAELLSKRRNDLETCAIKLFPEIASALNALKKAPNVLLSRMSGSGATCFGIFKNLPAAELAEKILRKKYPNWWVKKTRLIA